MATITEICSDVATKRQNNQKQSCQLQKTILTVAFANEPLAQYQVKYQPNKKELRQVTLVRLFETQYQARKNLHMALAHPR